MCDQTQNFSLSIKLVDKNHIIYNKKVTNTQNLFNLMKEKKIPTRLQVRQRGKRKNIANNCKVRSRNNEKLKKLCIYSGNFRLGRRIEQKKVVQVKLKYFFLFFFG